MSNGDRHGRRGHAAAPKDSRFAGSNAELPRLLWRNVHPLLLRSAGVVGLAGVIVAVVSNASLSDKPAGNISEQVMASSAPATGTEPELSSVPFVRPAAAQEAVYRTAALPPNGSAGTLTDERESDLAGAAPPTASPAVADSAVEEAAAEAAAEEAANAQARLSALMDAPPAAVAPLADTAPRDAVVEPVPAAKPSPKAIAAAQLRLADALSKQALAPETAGIAPEASPATAPAPEVEETSGEASSTGSLWAEDVDCARDWIASDGSSAGEPSGGCDPAETAAADPQPAELPMQSAALNLAPGAAELEVLPSAEEPTFMGVIPKPRPEPPANAVAKPPAPKRTAARGKLGPPPDCGKKYARWRYVNKQPTWYCK